MAAWYDQVLGGVQQNRAKPQRETSSSSGESPTFPEGFAPLGAGRRPLQPAEPTKDTHPLVKSANFARFQHDAGWRSCRGVTDRDSILLLIENHNSLPPRHRVAHSPRFRAARGARILPPQTGAWHNPLTAAAGRARTFVATMHRQNQGHLAPRGAARLHMDPPLG